MEIQLPDINNRTLNIHGFDDIDCKKVNVTDHYSGLLYLSLSILSQTPSQAIKQSMIDCQSHL